MTLKNQSHSDQQKNVMYALDVRKPVKDVFLVAKHVITMKSFLWFYVKDPKCVEWKGL